MVFIDQHDIGKLYVYGVKEKRKKKVRQKAFVTIVTACQRGSYTDLEEGCNIVMGQW